LLRNDSVDGFGIINRNKALPLCVQG
jgi:hypothetical protein